MFGTQSDPETPLRIPDASAEPTEQRIVGTDPATVVPAVVIALTIMLLGYVSPTSVTLALPVLLPWGLLAWAFTRRTEGDPAAVRSVSRLLLIGTGLPATLLALSAWFRAPLHEPLAGVVIAAAVLGALLAASLLVAVPALRAWPYLWLAVLASAIYGYGGGVAGNIVFDGSEPQLVRAPVVDKWVSNPVRTGRNRNTGEGPNLYVQIEGYGATRVNDEVYSYSKVGQPGCVHVRNGALGIEWFSIERCPPTPRTR